MEISISELTPLIGKINLIDIRNTQSFNNNHIEGAINIPFEKLIANPNFYLKRNQKYFLYCRCGISSRKAALILNNLGYVVFSIKGGYEEWILKG